MSQHINGGNIDRDVAFRVPIAIAKSGISVERRTVRGIMTQEIVDAHNEEVDFESVKACLADWRGNIREMHQPRAVGKAVDIVVLEDLRAVEVEAYVSTGAEDTWQKCLDGTLGYYSIGGVGDRVFGARRDGTNGPRLIMKRIGELSLVDSGACPTSTISVVKLVDDVPVQQLGDDAERAEGADDAQRVDAAIDSTSPASASDTPGVNLRKSVVVGANAAGHALALGILKGAGFRSERWNIANALAVFGLLEDLIVDESFENDWNENAPENAAQIDLLKLAAMIVIDFIATEFEQQFADATAFAMLADGDASIVKSIIEKKGARHSKSDSAMLQGMHDNCVKLGATCGVEKMGTTNTTKTETVDSAVADAAAVSLASGDTAADASSTSADAPAAAASSDVETTKAADAPATTVVGTVDVAELITKAVDAVSKSFATQIEELKATSAATIATLQDRVTKLSDEPAGGGPVANEHAVLIEKNGGEAMTALLSDRNVAERVIEQLETVAKSETDPAVRARLAEQSVALRMQHQIGAVYVPIPSQR